MTPQSDITKTLQEVHGDGDCHICGKPKAGPGEPICSYPHGMVPIKPVNPDHSDGFWEWSESENDTANPVKSR